MDRTTFWLKKDGEIIPTKDIPGTIKKINDLNHHCNGFVISIINETLSISTDYFDAFKACALKEGYLVVTNP